MTDTPPAEAIEVKQFETEDCFYQGEVLLGTQTQHGTGTMVSKTDMSKYVGQFEHGKKHGDGQIEYINPDFPVEEYMGGFKDDDYSGMGILMYRDGKMFKGDFAFGKPIEGMLTYLNGD